MIRISILGALLSVAAALPQVPYQQQQYTTPIPILSQKQEINPDGSYYYSYQTGNGIAAEEKGAVRSYGPDNEIQAVQGYFLYPGPDGVQYTITYTADENGYIAQGAHLPTPPPIPKEIEEALKTLPKDDNEYDDNGFPIKKQYGR